VASPPVVEAPAEPPVAAVPSAAPAVATVPASVDRPEAESPAVAPAAAAPVVVPAPEPAQSTAPTEVAQPAPVTPEAAPEADLPPHLTIKVASHGMMTAELDGQVEHIILDDLTAYGSALSKVGGSASIIVPQDDDMARLVARRAQRILEDAGVSITSA
jgi:hypothetical protein